MIFIEIMYVNITNYLLVFIIHKNTRFKLSFWKTIGNWKLSFNDTSGSVQKGNCWINRAIF